jgi:hypothetical protein
MLMRMRQRNVSRVMRAPTARTARTASCALRGGMTTTPTHLRHVSRVEVVRTQERASSPAMNV